VAERAVKWSGFALAAVVWASSILFALYILAGYIGDWVARTLMRWNDTLPGLYDARTPLATTGVGLHIAAGSVLLTLGFIQLIGPVRRAFPTLHAWIGRVYVVAAITAGIGGLTFVVVKGTIGGVAMNLGFGFYGVLTVLTAVQAYRYARRRDFERHRSWAIRLFALVIGSWLYRMDYGFWFIAMNGFGHTHAFSGPFDTVMDFAFYLPNLAVAEILIRSSRYRWSTVAAIAMSATCAVAAIVVLVGTYYFTKYYWGPAILLRL
jgi:hypothetical protein